MVTAEALVEALEPLVRRIIRQEFRAVGLRPPAPPGPGVWRWDAVADAWVGLLAEPSAHQTAESA